MTENLTAPSPEDEAGLDDEIVEGPVDAEELRESVRGSNRALLLSLGLIVLLMFAGALGVAYLVNNVHAITPS